MKNHEKTVLAGMLTDSAMNGRGEVFLKDYLPKQSDRREIFKTVLGSSFDDSINDYGDYNEIDEFMLMMYFVGLLKKDIR